MPEWFVKLFKREVDNMPYGEEYAKGAQRMWDAIVEGYSPEDYQKGPIADKQSLRWPWASEYDDEFHIQEQRQRLWEMREDLYTPEDIADIQAALAGRFSFQET
jgi:hypothetical protein